MDPFAVSPPESPPAPFARRVFECRHCGMQAQHIWCKPIGLQQPPLEKNGFGRKFWWAEKTLPGKIIATVRNGESEYNYGSNIDYVGLNISHCVVCEQPTIWSGYSAIWPVSPISPKPNIDLPPDILEDYGEALSISSVSPRGAAALLRLCIQKLTMHLGQSGKNLNGDIKALLENGLSPEIGKMLDIVRVTGNEAVHPAEMNLKDDAATVSTLFRIVNLIADELISRPKMVDEAWQKLPADKKEGIAKRSTPKGKS